MSQKMTLHYLGSSIEHILHIYLQSYYFMLRYLLN